MNRILHTLSPCIPFTSTRLLLLSLTPFIYQVGLAFSSILLNLLHFSLSHFFKTIFLQLYYKRIKNYYLSIIHSHKLLK